MDIIVSDADNSDICPFSKFVWKRHHQLVLATIAQLIQ